MATRTSSLHTASAVERYRLLVDAITDYAIYLLDTEGHVSSWNAGAQRFKGYSEQEILANISPVSTLPRTRLPACLQGRLPRPGVRDASKQRGGVFARTANGFGLTS